VGAACFNCCLHYHADGVAAKQNLGKFLPWYVEGKGVATNQNHVSSSCFGFALALFDDGYFIFAIVEKYSVYHNFHWPILGQWFQKRRVPSFNRLVC
jgi:hypothetical protein